MRRAAAGPFLLGMKWVPPGANLRDTSRTRAFPSLRRAYTSRELAPAPQQLQRKHWPEPRHQQPGPAAAANNNSGSREAMGALPLLLPSAPARCSCAAGLAGPRRFAATPSSPSSVPSNSTLRLLRSSCGRQRWASVARAGGGEGEGGKGGAAKFFGEDGVVEDMDGYMDYLSLEYDSVWDTKPAWCQPWTILLSGTTAIAFSWVLIQSVLITSAVSLVICAWWYIFLYSYPKAYTEMIAERRRKVASGAEDTYGMEKFQ